MSEWIKIGVGAAGAVVVAWTMIQQHEYRLGQLEHAIDQHLTRHEKQFDEINHVLRGIDITLARMQSANDESGAYPYQNGGSKVSPTQMVHPELMGRLKK
jgi:hypothetical protein